MINNEIKISIIMSVYNEKINWLKKSIESILNQSYSEFEFIIVLDNPSNDEIRETLELFEVNDNRIKLIKNDTNIGLVASLNKAIKISRGKYIARMDADDICYLNRLEKQLNFLESNPMISLVGSKIEYINEEDTLIKKDAYRPTKHEEIKELIEYANMFAHPTIMFKRDVILKLGLYKEALYAEDYEFMISLILNGYKVANLEEILLKYRLRENGISISKRPYQFLTCDYLQREYRKNKNKNNYEFSENNLNNLYEKKNGKYIVLVDKIYNKYIQSLKNNSFRGYIYLVFCSIMSSIYRRNILNRIILKKKLRVMKG